MSIRALRDATAAALAVSLLNGPAGAHDGHGERRRSEIGVYGQALPAGAAAPSDWSAPALRDDLGRHGWPVASRDARAQAYFDQGLRQAWGFNHGEAVRAFRAAQAFDPGCAMCLWAEAWALGPNINFPMAADANARAIEALATARRLMPRPGSLAAALTEALSARHSADPAADRAALDAAYAAAMRAVRMRFPDELEVAVLTADALMNLSPWDYWAEGGSRAKGATAEIIALLEGVLGLDGAAATASLRLRTNPEHIGAIHLYIHMVEASDRPERAAALAARLPTLAPGAGHLVHMPSHLWYRMGEWRRSLAANQAAVAVDERELARGGASLIWAEAYHAHNVHFVLASALMGGDGAAAIGAADRLAGLVSRRAAEQVPWTLPIVAAPWVARARFAAPEAVLAMPRPAVESGYVEAHWRYARGVALARLGRAADALVEAEAIATLSTGEDVAALDQGGVPARAVIGIAAEVLRGRAAQARGDHATAVRRFAAAAAAQEALPYMEPPFWYYPVRQSLGATLLAAGRPAEAMAAFRQVLVAVPNNGWAASGLLAAAVALGDATVAAEARELIGRGWFGGALPAPERL